MTAPAALTSPMGAGTGEPAAAGTGQTSRMIEFAKVQGKVQAEAIKHVGELADNNPNETAAIIRSWLTEAAST
jgi:flagellar M-ring protein FliF